MVHPASKSSTSFTNTLRRLLNGKNGPSDAVQQNIEDVVLSPAQRLIPDLVSQIFHYCVVSDKPIGKEEFPRPNTSMAPLKLARICHAWRQVALCTPNLWASLQIPPFWVSPVGLKEWLQRSGGCALSFSWTSSSTKAHQHRRSICSIADVLLQHASRWKHVELTVPRTCLLHLLSPLSRNRPPPLESISITPTFASDDDFIDHLTHIFVSHLPMLSRLTLPGSNFTLSWGNDTILDNLRELTITRPLSGASLTLNVMLPLLQCCPRITLVDVFMNDQAFLHGNPPQLTIPLEKLSITISGSSQVTILGYLLDHLYLPALSELTLMLDLPVVTVRGWPHLLSLLSRSQCSLLRLTVKRIPILEEGLIECLRLIPHLQMLYLYGLRVSNVLLHSLAENAEHILPSLTQMHVQCGVFDQMTLCAMVRSRWENGNRKLCHIVVYACGTGPIEDEKVKGWMAEKSLTILVLST
ncbi:hypothetical protein BD410DRAFT_894670 [Rickenella mellea]|uniref:F-box domain-containing protein n=1 Tax=Rickenella mellea TaxID=50990 RepID=A0A4Y7QK52_9AGAM|nr:hypothetical protein BD410DRAFT_894670 [Rickenella mellea]